MIRDDDEQLAKSTIPPALKPTRIGPQADLVGAPAALPRPPSSSAVPPNGVNLPRQNTPGALPSTRIGPEINAVSAPAPTPLARPAETTARTVGVPVTGVAADVTGFAPSAQVTGLERPSNALTAMLRAANQQQQGNGSPLAQVSQGTFSVVGGRGPEMQKSVDQRVAEIEKQIATLQSLRTPDRPAGGGLHLPTDGGGGYGLLSNDHAAHRRADLAASRVSPGRYDDVYKAAIAGERQALGLPTPEERMQRESLIASDRAQQPLNAETQSRLALDTQQQAHQQQIDWATVENEKQRFAADAREERAKAAKDDPLNPRNIVDFALEGLEKAQQGAVDDLGTPIPFDADAYVKDRAALYLKHHGAMMDSENGQVHSAQDIAEFAKEQGVDIDKAKEWLRQRGLLG